MAAAAAAASRAAVQPSVTTKPSLVRPSVCLCVCLCARVLDSQEGEEGVGREKEKEEEGLLKKLDGYDTEERKKKGKTQEYFPLLPFAIHGLCPKKITLV